MATTRQLEERIRTLEEKVEALSARFSSRRRPRKHWLTSMAGCMADFPEFAEVVRLGKEWRDSYKQPEADTEIDKPKAGMKGRRNGSAKNRDASAKAAKGNGKNKA